MPRNFRRRVEVMYPVLDEALRRRVIEELVVMRKDNCKAWALGPDGSYQRVVEKDHEPIRSQVRFMELARERARENEGLLGLSSSKSLPGPARALDKLRRRGKKKRRRTHGE
jgi:polyphosphate kinase